MLLQQNSKRRRRSAFTLMEMLVVVAIIVALAGIGGYFLMGALGKSQEDIARANVKTLSNACDQYKMRNGDYPNDLLDLTVKDVNGNPRIVEPDAIFDPWKRKYVYERSGTNNGVDGRPDIYTIPPDSPTKKIGNWSERRPQ